MSAKQQWTKQQKLKFVQEYVKYQSLLAPVPGRKNETKTRKVLRNDVLVQLSKSMGIPGFGPKDAYGKLRNIKSTYAQELKKIRKAAAHGTKYVPNLIWFKTLDKAYKNPKKSEYTEMFPSESSELEAATTLNESYSVKLEQYEEEEADAENYKEHSENEMQIMKSESIYREVHKCVNCNDKSGNTCDTNEGMSSINNQVYIKNEFDVFGESIAAQLKKMPLEDALEAQMYIQNYLCNLRLQALRFQNSVKS